MSIGQRQHRQRLASRVYLRGTLTADHVIQYKGRALQLEPGARVPKKSQVLVREQRDGAVHVVHVSRDGHERRLRWTTNRPSESSPPLTQNPRTVLLAYQRGHF